MLQINEREIRSWSRLGPRATYGLALTTIMESDANIIAMGADTVQASGLKRVMNTMPKRCINVGIAEQNLIGVAAGLSKLGFVPFASSFAPFATLRCADQIRMNLAYMNLNIKIVGLASGCSLGNSGYSHYGLEDIALLSAIPNITILSPADCGQVTIAVRTASSHKGPVYIRLTGEPGMKAVYNKDSPMQIGSSNLLLEGKDVAIFATGSMVSCALEAAFLLKPCGVDCSVFDMYCLKPLDAGAIDNISSSTRLVVTIEEHSIIGGLGSMVADRLCTKSSHPPLLKCGIPSYYIKAGSYEYMKEQFALTGESVSQSIKKRLEVL